MSIPNMGFGSIPVAIISCPNGNSLSADFTVSALLERETVKPSLTSAAAALRFAGGDQVDGPN